MENALRKAARWGRLRPACWCWGWTRWWRLRGGSTASPPTSAMPGRRCARWAALRNGVQRRRAERGGEERTALVATEVSFRELVRS